MVSSPGLTLSSFHGGGSIPKTVSFWRVEAVKSFDTCAPNYMISLVIECHIESWSQSKLEKQENKCHFLVGRVAKSPCKGAWHMRWEELLWPSLHIIWVCFFPLHCAVCLVSLLILETCIFHFGTFESISLMISFCFLASLSETPINLDVGSPNFKVSLYFQLCLLSFTFCEISLILSFIEFLNFSYHVFSFFKLTLFLCSFLIAPVL